MTGPLAPVGILNPIRASLGIPPDSTFPENALAGRESPEPHIHGMAIMARHALSPSAPRAQMRAPSGFRGLTAQAIVPKNAKKRPLYRVAHVRRAFFKPLVI
jgi:hypothetical protein